MPRVRVILKHQGLDDIEREFESLPSVVLDAAEKVLNDVGKLSAEKMRGHFSNDTGPPVKGGALRNRSWDAYASIGHRVVRDNKTKMVRMEVGGINGSPETQQYLETQNVGRVIKPLFADKLAFPPGREPWGPARDEDGVQIMWLHEFLENAEAMGYSFVQIMEDVVRARPEGSRDFEIVFYRRDEVIIPARAPIDSEEEATTKHIIERLNAMEF